MRREPKTHTKDVTVLTNAKPAFVSLVGAGANNTPLLVVKCDDPEEMELMSKIKTAKADIASLSFKGDTFATEASVQAWLDKGGYKDTTITKSDDGFTVAGNAEVKDPVALEVEKGVVAMVGKSDVPVPALPRAHVTATEGRKTEEPKTGAQKDADGATVAIETRWGFAKPAADAPLPKLVTRDADGSLNIARVATKSAYTMSSLADVVSSLVYVTQSTAWECEYDRATEADRAILAQLQSNLRACGETLIAMAKDVVDDAIAITSATKEDAMTTAANATKTDTAVGTVQTEAEKAAAALAAGTTTAATTAATAEATTEATAEKSDAEKAFDAAKAAFDTASAALDAEKAAKAPKGKKPEGKSPDNDDDADGNANSGDDKDGTPGASAGSSSGSDDASKGKKKEDEKPAEPTLADIMAAVQSIKGDTAKVADRVSAIENRSASQSQKSAGVEDLGTAKKAATDSALKPAAKTAQEISAEVQEHNSRNLMGF